MVARCPQLVHSSIWPPRAAVRQTRDGQQDLEVGPAEPRTVPLDEVCSRAANDVGHLEPWPTHLLLLGQPTFLQDQRVQRTGGGMQVALRKVEIASGLFQIVMA